MTETLTQLEISRLGIELLKIVEHNWSLTSYPQWIDGDQDVICNERVRQIGEQLNRIGGLPAMQGVIGILDSTFQEREDELSMVFSSDINWAWNGIGDWQA
jgi:hypothetical protein